MHPLPHVDALPPEPPVLPDPPPDPPVLPDPPPDPEHATAAGNVGGIQPPPTHTHPATGALPVHPLPHVDALPPEPPVLPDPPPDPEHATAAGNVGGIQPPPTHTHPATGALPVHPLPHADALPPPPVDPPVAPVVPNPPPKDPVHAAATGLVGGTHPPLTHTQPDAGGLPAHVAAHETPPWGWGAPDAATATDARDQRRHPATDARATERIRPFSFDSRSSPVAGAQRERRCRDSASGRSLMASGKASTLPGSAAVDVYLDLRGAAGVIQRFWSNLACGPLASP